MKSTAPFNTSDGEAPARDQSDAPSIDDEALMQAIQRREPLALDALLQRYRLLLRSVILRVVHSHASADDVMQECMLEIWHHAGNYCVQKGSPLGWIVTLAKRRAIDYLRRQQTYIHAKDRLQDDTVTNVSEQVRDAA